MAESLSPEEIQYLKQVWRVEASAVRSASPLFFMARNLKRRGYLTCESGARGWHYYSLTSQGMAAIGFTRLAPAPHPPTDTARPDARVREIAARQVVRKKEYLRYKEIYFEHRDPPMDSFAVPDIDMLLTALADAERQRDAARAALVEANTLLMQTAMQLSSTDKSDAINVMIALGKLMKYTRSHNDEYDLISLMPGPDDEAAALADSAPDAPADGEGM
jgi:hypothetical protein